MPSESAIKRRMTGQPDSRGPQGMMARGSNVYRGGAPNAHSGGGPQFGRPPVGSPNGGGMMPPPGNSGAPPAGGMPPGMGPPGGMPPQGGAPPVDNPMAPILENMKQMEPIQPSPSGATGNPIMEAMQQGGPPGEGGVGGNPNQVSPEILAAIVRRLGARDANS